MNKKISLGLLLFCIITSFSFASRISLVAVVDLNRIVSDFFRESSAWREVDELTRRTEQTINQRAEEIEQLKQDRIDAREAGNNRLALELEEEINERQSYLQEYHRVMNSRIQNMRENLLTSSDFSAEIINTIAYVAENEGYSIVYRKSDSNLLYYNYDIDITDKVLTQLRRRASQ